MPASPPTKYTPKLLKKAYKYLEDWKKDKTKVIPSVSSLSLYLDISRDTLMTWQRDKSKTEIIYILKRIKEKQRETLISQGLSGKFNSAITKLVLGKHGFHDKQDTTLGSDAKNPLKIVIEVVDGNAKNTNS